MCTREGSVKEFSVLKFALRKDFVIKLAEIITFR